MKKVYVVVEVQVNLSIRLFWKTFTLTGADRIKRITRLNFPSETYREEVFNHGMHIPPADGTVKFIVYLTTDSSPLLLP